MPKHRLGLYIISEIVRAHGGSINVKSDAAETLFIFRCHCARPKEARTNLLSKIKGERGGGGLLSASRGRRELPHMAKNTCVTVRFRQEPAFIGKHGSIRLRTTRGNKQRDSWPSFRGVLGEGETVHRARHLNMNNTLIRAACCSRTSKAAWACSTSIM